MKTRTLYGKRVVPHHLLTYAEQIYDILLGEIQAGRWRVGERLPGLISLAREVGLGTKTVQLAYDRLKQEGYLRALGYRGTYLKSVHPLSPVVQGRLGVLLAPDQAAQPLILWYEHVILQVAARKGLAPEIRNLPDGMNPQEARRPGALFSESVFGILSLHAFLSPLRDSADHDVLPLVFLCPPYERCAPKVCADVREAYYDLTCRVIGQGHRHIVFSEDGVEPDPRQTDLHREGYLEAMREHGLPVDEKMMGASRLVRNSNLEEVSQHLRALRAPAKRVRPTAVVAGSLGRSMALVRVAPLCGVSIPGDLSVVSIGSAHLDETESIELTGMHPDFHMMVERCFVLLEEQRQPAGCNTTAWYVRMRFVPGGTLGPPATASGSSANRSPGSTGAVFT